MKKIIHIDMDCFFAAIEMRDNPRYRTIPIAVGGDPKKRGVVCTANYIARGYGIHSAMAMTHAVKRCPQLKVIPLRMGLYKDVSMQIHAIFRRYTQIIEAVSLDEAYLDVTRSPFCLGSATLIAEQIRRAIMDELNLTASAGVAPLKFLAKIASEINKPNGQCVIAPNDVNVFIQSLPLKKIPGVGHVTGQKLAELGLNTCADLQHYDLSKLLKQFGKFGHVLYERSRGIDARAIHNERQRKSVGVEKTCPKDIQSWGDCLALVDSLYDELVDRLSRVRPDLTIARQGVKFKFSDFQSTTIEHIWNKLDKDDLILLAKKIWEERRGDRGVRLVGFHVTLINPLLDKQLALAFED